MATVNGTSANDTLSGTAGDDTINGLGGNDLFLAGSTGGNDLIDGGTGFDTIEFRERATSAIVVDFVAGTISGGSSGTIRFVNVERVIGGNFDDTLTGNAASQTLTGRFGADTLWGAGGVDTLWGGGDGNTFVFRETGTANADLINDFASGSDKILLDASVMSALGASGNFAAGDGRFVLNSAQDAEDRIIYNTTTRQIFYDADGNGTGAAVLIATLQSGATLAATDIVVEGTGAPGGGGSGSNTIVGTEGNDSLTGTDGNDTINGLGGNDTLNGMAGSDRLDGGLGNDVFHVENQADVLIDAGGIDTVIARDIGSWTLAPGFENLVLDNGEERGPYVGIGNELNNHISASWGSSLEGREGNDTLIGAHGDPFEADRTNYLSGGVGNDNLIGGHWVEDVLDGGAGDDTLYGGSHDRDTLIGGAGADTFVHTHLYPDDYSEPETISDFASGQDLIRLDAEGSPDYGASGRLAPGDPRFYAAPGAILPHDSDDRFIFDTSSGRLWVYDGDTDIELVTTVGSGSGAASLVATDIEVINGTTPPPPPPPGSVINGTSGNDTLSGTSGSDTINGLGGNDLFVAGSTGGNDVIDGGTGHDTIEFRERATSAVVVDFGTGSISGGSSGTISFSNVERVVGGDFNDSMSGNAASQTLTGKGGNDTLWGAGGVDTLWGLAGADTFVFREIGTANADRISDWTSGVDTLALDNATMGALGAEGDFVTNDTRFASGAGFTSGRDPSDRVVFDTSTGRLYYDADGSATGAVVQLIATVQSGASVAATDIVVI